MLITTDRSLPLCGAGKPARSRPARERRQARWRAPRFITRPSRWRLPALLAIFAVYATAEAAFAGGDDAIWGRWAAPGYAIAAILLWFSPRRHILRGVSIACAFGAAVAGPALWLITRAPVTSDAMVVARSAVLLVHHGDPYLPAGQLVSWLSYNPYLPGMALFGLPHAAGLPGPLGDTRPWLVVVTFVLLAATFAVAARRRANPADGVLPGTSRRVWTGSVGNAAFAVATPLIALPLSVGITDPPVLALLCLALACAGRGALRWTLAAGAAVGVACAMKTTAWPALPVLAAMLARRDGARAALRFGIGALVTAGALVAVTAPHLLLAPSAFIQNTVDYPLGLTRHVTPAESPLPGHLLAGLGPAGHTAATTLLVAAGLAVAASLVIRPPRDVLAAAWRLTIGLTLMIMLAPATRFGYLAYPAAMLGWLLVEKHRSRAARLAMSTA